MHRRCLIIPLATAAMALLAGISAGEGPLSNAARQTERRSGAPEIELEDLTGKRHRPAQIGEKKAAVVIFVLHDCPISNKYAPEIQRLQGDFSAKNSEFYLVHVDPELSLNDAKKHAKEYGYEFPVLIDQKHELVRHFKATTAPEAFVVGPGAKVLYRGRIDDRYVAIGKARNQVQRQDLRLALAAVVEGKAVEVTETKPIGCYIPELAAE